MKRSNPSPARGRHFICQSCGSQVYRPQSGWDDDSICLNCWYGRVIWREEEVAA